MSAGRIGEIQYLSRVDNRTLWDSLWDSQLDLRSDELASLVVEVDDQDQASPNPVAKRLLASKATA